MDADHFSRYFGAEVLYLEGRMFPVEVIVIRTCILRSNDQWEPCPVYLSIFTVLLLSWAPVRLRLCCHGNHPTDSPGNTPGVSPFVVCSCLLSPIWVPVAWLLPCLPVPSHGLSAAGPFHMLFLISCVCYSVYMAMCVCYSVYIAMCVCYSVYMATLSRQNVSAFFENLAFLSVIMREKK